MIFLLLSILHSGSFCPLIRPSSSSTPAVITIHLVTTPSSSTHLPHHHLTPLSSAPSPPTTRHSRPVTVSTQHTSLTVLHYTHTHTLNTHHLSTLYSIPLHSNRLLTIIYSTRHIIYSTLPCTLIHGQLSPPLKISTHHFSPSYNPVCTSPHPTTHHITQPHPIPNHVFRSTSATSHNNPESP